MNNQLMQSDRSSPPQLAGPQGPAHGPRTPENPLLLVRRYLRGRYHWAILLGGLLSVPGAIAGYLAIPPVYKSTGIVRVAPTMPKVLYQTEETGPMAGFDSFVSAQTAFLQSRRVLDMAVSNDKLKEAGWPSGTDGLSLLNKAVEAQNGRGSELIYVSVSHKNPILAQAAVNAVLDSYTNVEDELNGTKAQQREAQLQQLTKDYQRDIESLQQQILTLSQEFGTDGLDAMHAAKMKLLISLEADTSELDRIIARRKAEVVAASPDQNDELKNGEPDLLKLAASDEALARYMSQEEQARGHLAGLETKYSPSHRAVVSAKQDLEMIQAMVRARAKIVAQSPTRPGAFSGALPLKELEQQRDNLGALYQAALDEVKRINRTRIQIQTLRDQIERTKGNLGDANTRITQMQVERDSIKTGRISIAQKGDVPVSPFTDRRKPLAAFGGLAGLGLGIALVWAFGFFRDGYRYVEELETTATYAPLLGIIPDLTGDDGEQDKQAALSVHHIRNTMQLQTEGGPPDQARVFTITSATSGDGKTHLSLALGLSFAMAGRRTLLIDADLIGRALTSQLGLDNAPGLSEAVHAESLNGEVHAARHNLWAIPAGLAADFRPELLSSFLMARLLEKARGSFDTIIIDTGPIMGSLEANLASPLSDRVVLVVSRGQDPKVVRAALGRIRTIGATCAGMVFNRAAAKDFAQSISNIATSGRLSANTKRDRAPVNTTLTRLMNVETAEAPGDPDS